MSALPVRFWFSGSPTYLLGARYLALICGVFPQPSGSGLLIERPVSAQQQPGNQSSTQHRPPWNPHRQSYNPHAFMSLNSEDSRHELTAKTPSPNRAKVAHKSNHFSAPRDAEAVPYASTVY
ncbi:hypothetical protein ARMSODRAFT_958244 [Armillaria solidipes]|uniref:Uncharacterized protein n=1 Tax=Armillaria solidipes TaxID=1076256 RepID=A0A2H3BCJ3_9AGAR|nr:hypothetical protein ARMSODRAFT_958244 [Armillaria solidipes]